MYEAFKELDSKDIEYVCAAPHIAKLPKFGPEELEYVSAIDRIIQLEARMNMCEQTLNDHKVEQLSVCDKIKDIESNMAPTYAATVQKPKPGTSIDSQSANAKMKKDNPPKKSTPVVPSGGTRNNRQSVTDPQIISDDDSGSFTLVERHKKPQKRRNVTVGTGSHEGVQGAPAPSRDIVIERVMRSTTIESLRKLIVKNGITVRSLEVLSHVDAKYQKFKLEIPKHDLQKVYNGENWPVGVCVRPYFPPKKGKVGNQSETQSDEAQV